MSKRGKRARPVSVHPAVSNLTLIIGLIVLLCLPSGLALMFASSQFESSQRSIIIAFLILFPMIGLGIAIWLILRQTRQLAVKENDDGLDWRTMRPEDQRHKLDVEITELAKALAIPQEQISDLRSAYIVAEDLALRKIEQEAKIPLRRHIEIDTLEFDGLLIEEEIVKCVEVTFLVKPNVSQPKINGIFNKVNQLKAYFDEARPGTKVVLMLVLVTQLDAKDEFKLRSNLSSKLAATPVDVDIRLFDFEDLQKIYASD